MSRKILSFVLYLYNFLRGHKDVNVIYANECSNKNKNCQFFYRQNATHFLIKFLHFTYTIICLTKAGITTNDIMQVNVSYSIKILTIKKSPFFERPM